MLSRPLYGLLDVMRMAGTTHECGLKLLKDAVASKAGIQSRNVRPNQKRVFRISRAFFWLD